jgi:hypothetical protein
MSGEMAEGELLNVMEKCRMVNDIWAGGRKLSSSK